MEDNSGKKFSLQDWVMKRAANQSGGAMPSHTARQFLSEHAAEEDVPQTQIQQPEISLDVEMKAVSNGSTISSPAPSISSQEEIKAAESQPSKKEDYTKDSALSSLNGANNPLQQLQIVRLLTDLGDRLRQSEKEREILWKEVEICRKQISDMNGQAGKSEKSFSSLESQMNQREVFVKELVEKQIGLEQKLKDQTLAFDAAKEEQSKLQEEQTKLQDKLQEKLNYVETAAGSAIVRVEDVMAENSKLAKKVEQLGQDKARLVRKLEIVEETLTQTQDILKAKALVLLTDQSVAARTNLPQEPAWTGDDTLKVSQAVHAPKSEVAANSPVSNITASLKPSATKLPSMFMITIVTAIIAGLAAFGAIWIIKHVVTDDKVAAGHVESNNANMDALIEKASQLQPEQNQDQFMAQAAKMASQIEPGGLDALDGEGLQSSDDKSGVANSDGPIFDAAQVAQHKAIEDFKAAAPTAPLSSRMKSDKSLPKSVAVIEAQAFTGDAFAQHDLAAIYTAGHGGIKIDYAKAAKWFEEAAHNGSSNAQYNLGVLYHQGLGVQKNTAKAIELYRVAASNNHPEALYNLAIAYVEGVGVEYNPQIAASYFERSADGGVVEAAYNLGLLHENGLLGESQPDEAVFWYKIAADKGNKEAVQSLAELKKKLSMTDEDVNRLTQKIAATKPAYLNDEGQASLPQQVKPDAEKAAESAKSVKPKAAAAQGPATGADPVVISQIQEQLMRLGLYKGIPNGAMSAPLVQAIKTYQTKNGLKADGQATDDLLVQMLASGSEAKAAATAINQ
ncbi:MAG TPA: hypothetical protein DCM27_05150 [Rhodospirillaceae bacterium]|nr:hypothetical protein [Rhodospirillaceae bacterium]